MLIQIFNANDFLSILSNDADDLMNDIVFLPNAVYITLIQDKFKKSNSFGIAFK